MATLCTACGVAVDEQGRLAMDWACTETDLHQCVTGIQGDPDGNTRGFGSPQQWPKRISSQINNDPDNAGYHQADRDGDGDEDGNPNSDDPTFIGSSVRAFVAAGDASCPTSTPGYESSDNRIVAEQAEGFTNTFDTPVLVQVQTSGWYHDLTVPQVDDGGARFLGEARVGVSEDNAAFTWMEWQRAAEINFITRPNGDYDSDPQGIAGAMSNVSATTIGVLEKYAECFDQAVSLLEAVRCDEGESVNVGGLQECSTQAKALIALTQARFTTLAERIVAADVPTACNPAYLTRRVDTHGSWQHEVMVLPGQTLRVETRTKFAHWSAGACSGAAGSFCYCQASGSARAGRIDLTIWPIHGGRDCGPTRFSRGPWYGQRGTIALGTEHH